MATCTCGSDLEMAGQHESDCAVIASKREAVCSVHGHVQPCPVCVAAAREAMGCTAHQWKEENGRGHTYVCCAVCHRFPPSHLSTLKRAAELEQQVAELHRPPQHSPRQL